MINDIDYEGVILADIDLIRTVSRLKKMINFNSHDLGAISSYGYLVDKYGFSVVDTAFKLNDSYYHKQLRLKNFISNMINCGECLFLTLTFNDYYLNSTSYDTRRVYVRRFLKWFNTYAVANVDYGKTNGREHYHAIICYPHVDHELWPYGSINFQRVRINEDTSSTCISKYIVKLSRHAIKNTTGKHLIYLRPKKIKNF